MSILDLKISKDKHIFYQDSKLEEYKEEVLRFLNYDDYMRDFDFAKEMLLSQGIKFNNDIEGINNDISSIDKAISTNSSEAKKILNLYNGYQYILSHKDINKESLKELYDILSDGLLDEYSRTNMGLYYREKPVYVYQSSRIDTYPITGTDSTEIDYYMDELFEYINNGKDGDDVENFIKSQIIHFFFVYIHPYFDVNGRTSRTLSMWYLLNNNNYPYIIFNRAIAFSKKEYEMSIAKGREIGNITEFLKYLLKYVEIELEKEYVKQVIKMNSNESLSIEEMQTLQYILFMNGNLTAKDYASIYNRFNDPKRIGEIIKEQIMPLIEKGIILYDGETSSYIDQNTHNFSFHLNPELIDVDLEKFNSLKLTKYLKK